MNQKNKLTKSKSAAQPSASKTTAKPNTLQKLPITVPEISDSEVLTKVMLTSDDDIRFMAITDKIEAVNTSAGILWYEHRFAESVLNAVYAHKNRMEFKGIQIEVREIKRGKRGSMNESAADKLSNLTPVPVYIYKMKQALNRYNVETVTVQVYFPDVRKHIPLSAYYSKKQHKYFMNADTYNDAMAAYGLPYVRPFSVRDDGTIDDFSSKLSATSQLKLLGYNVSAQSDYSDGYRQSLLAKIISYNLMTKAQVMNHLEFLIHFHGHNIRYDDAVEKWKADLRFVRDYNTHKQREVVGRIVQSRR